MYGAAPAGVSSFWFFLPYSKLVELCSCIPCVHFSFPSLCCLASLYGLVALMPTPGSSTVSSVSERDICHKKFLCRAQYEHIGPPTGVKKIEFLTVLFYATSTDDGDR